MKITILCAAACLYLATQTLFAADLYRCGNTFQDTPCAGAVKSKVVGTSNANNTTLPAKVVDRDCMQQGEAAKKIMWMREIGKTAEDQISTATDYATKKLIPQVYQLRGSSIEVKSMIEHECMLQKERDLLAEKMLIQAERLRNGENPSSADLKTSQVTESLNEPVNKPLATKNTNKIGQCNDYQSELETISAQRRKGGSTAYMENLKMRRNTLEADIKSTGC